MTWHKWRVLAVCMLATVIALAPALAEARAGGGNTSSGSRGSRTGEANSAKPMERSVTTPSSPSTAPSTAGRPSTAAPSPAVPAAQPSFFQRNPFLTGIAGGFLGAGLAGMFFGNSAWAADGSSGGSMLGLILQFALIGGLIWLAIRIFRRRSEPAEATVGAGMADTAYARTATAQPIGTARSGNPVEIAVAEEDYKAWSELLVGIQTAWSNSDLVQLRRYMTPEMVSYFSEELSRNASRGVENKIEKVTLTKGDVEEAWQEDGFEYVTARLRWTALDYTVRTGTTTVVEGNATHEVEATEVWTFVRSRGGSWLLSAIQQV